jgi:hypothetical protein
MKEHTLKPEPFKKFKIDMDPAFKKKFLKIDHEAQIVIHFTFKGRMPADKVRIWRTTYLIADNCKHIAQLVHAENISFYPDWTFVKTNQVVHFTLIFKSLPSKYKWFDLHEQIPEKGGFFIPNIERNNTDVYHLEV